MQEETRQETRIGELLIQEGFITQGQLERALQAQQAGSPYRPLGEVCKDLGLISRTNLRDFLDQHGKRLLLGDLLLRMGAISESSLIGGLETQEQTKERLGEILVRQATISRQALVNALGIQLTIPTIEPDPDLVDSDLVHAVSSKFLYNKRAVPICRKQVEGVITVAMEDPLDRETVFDLEKIFGVRVEPAILTHGRITNLLDDVYNSWSQHLNLGMEESRPASPPPEPKKKRSLFSFR